MRLGSHAVRLPVETLRTAHVFTEMNRGLYSGMNRTAKDGGNLLPIQETNNYTMYPIGSMYGI